MKEPKKPSDLAETIARVRERLTEDENGWHHYDTYRGHAVEDLRALLAALDEETS